MKLFMTIVDLQGIVRCSDDQQIYSRKFGFWAKEASLHHSILGKYIILMYNAYTVSCVFALCHMSNCFPIKLVYT